MTPHSLNLEKQRVREAVLAARDALSAEFRMAASDAIEQRVAESLPQISQAIVSGYLSIRSEVNPRDLMQQLADRGHRLCVPAIVAGELEFRQLEAGALLQPQGFGTAAPGPDVAVLRPDIMLVPLAAFDRQGGRMGYGKGFYDRAIARFRADGAPLMTIGLAFSVQEVGAVPMSDHDEPLDMIVTECSTFHRL
ncbi:5-formyltetrahydrofolate cyclo-ligase [Aureimonas fodinaquatilis]|uniref:5-formyltetrahydrofolate cyclo-ligase n=1 Tax=Aureimonas fodinaquatilis TaxID=2565783 RepID=A0A5B0E064_9HYPH|nr:5-formyltetrahydrofolate cyclo-ligase [Aureimonas fodinaquatilis]KAA0971150.1 5-formyltetrahydrofolate cyclo-ligase [Aureimonas fodinaquatilis]